MHLVIISGAARPQSRSNTAKIITAFQKGYAESGNTTEVWYLSDRRQWKNAGQAFTACDNILIALPLYVENIPGILLEFLEELTPKTVPGTRLAFFAAGWFSGSVSEPMLRKISGITSCTAWLFLWRNADQG